MKNNLSRRSLLIAGASGLLMTEAAFGAEQPTLNAVSTDLPGNAEGWQITDRSEQGFGTQWIYIAPPASLVSEWKERMIAEQVRSIKTPYWILMRTGTYWAQYRLYVSDYQIGRKETRFMYGMGAGEDTGCTGDYLTYFEGGVIDAEGQVCTVSHTGSRPHPVMQPGDQYLKLVKQTEDLRGGLFDYHAGSIERGNTPFSVMATAFKTLPFHAHQID